MRDAQKTGREGGLFFLWNFQVVRRGGLLGLMPFIW